MGQRESGFITVAQHHLRAIGRGQHVSDFPLGLPEFQFIPLFLNYAAYASTRSASSSTSPPAYWDAAPHRILPSASPTTAALSALRCSPIGAAARVAPR